MSRKSLPYADELEESLLGGMILYPKNIGLCEPYVNEQQIWGSPKCWRLYNIIKRLTYENVPVDIGTICSKITSEDKHIGLDAYWVTGLSQTAGLSGSMEPVSYTHLRAHET